MVERKFILLLYSPLGIQTTNRAYSSIVVAFSIGGADNYRTTSQPIKGATRSLFSYHTNPIVSARYGVPVVVAYRQRQHAVILAVHLSRIYHSL